jgi:hypothetical protein
MYDKHWTDDELFTRLYDLQPEDDHLENCLSCAQRLNAIRKRYEGLCTSQIKVSPELLAAQRRAIYARIRQQHRSLRRVLVPVVASLLVAAAAIAYRTSLVVPPPKAPISDSELFDDVFNRISDPLPTSEGPIRSLFEEQK